MAPEPPTQDLPRAAIAWAERAVGEGARVVGAEPLAGATSAAVHALRVRMRSGTETVLVLRRFVRADWLALEPDLAVREARVLRAVAPLPIPTPELLAVDEDGSHCDVPALLMTRLPGRVVLEPDDRGAWLCALAEPLLVLHASPVEAMPALAYRPWYDREGLEPPAWSDRPELWEAVIERVQAPLPESDAVAIHRDYHPANVLFQGSAVSGVVDWTNACRGPFEIDLAHCRLNLVLLHGPDVADAFLAAWRDLGGADPDPTWDLVDTCECLPKGGPTWYAGWHSLGVPPVAPPVLHTRLETHLHRTLQR